jgi:phenylacetate-coenzyme A ligase PaaK-like adenylate-forming protein
VGSITATSCPCGRTFRLLSELEGRVEDILELPGKRYVHPRAVWQVLKDDRELLQYQLIQHEPLRFELALVTVDEGAYDRVVEKAIPQLQALLGTESRIDVHRRADVVRTERGKFRAVSSRCRTT